MAAAVYLGEGQIDFPQFFAGLARRGFAGSLSYEGRAITAGGDVDLAGLAASLALLRELAAA